MLFHLLEKDKINIYDIPIDEITDQYIEYLHAMQELDLNIASEFLVMASNLLYIKSKMLLPLKKDESEDEEDPRDELVNRLIEYKKFKQASAVLKENEEKWSRATYRAQADYEFKTRYARLDIDPETLSAVMRGLTAKLREKMINLSGKMRYITRNEKITIRGKINEILNVFRDRTSFMFSELFSLKKATRLDVVTGFMAILELSKHNRIKLRQKKAFSDIHVARVDDERK